MRGGWLRWCGMLWMAMLLSACGDADLDQLDAQLAELAGQPSQRSRDWEVDERNESRPAYRHASDRSPFRMDEWRDLPDMASMGLPAPALSQYSLGQLELQGTLARGGTYWALVAAPDGQLHRLGIAQRLGRDAWLIVGIDNASMTVVAKGSAGEQAEKTQVMRLGAPRPQG